MGTTMIENEDEGKSQNEEEVRQSAGAPIHTHPETVPNTPLFAALSNKVLRNTASTTAAAAAAAATGE